MRNLSKAKQKADLTGRVPVKRPIYNPASGKTAMITFWVSPKKKKWHKIIREQHPGYMLNPNPKVSKDVKDALGLLEDATNEAEFNDIYDKLNKDEKKTILVKTDSPYIRDRITRDIYDEAYDENFFKLLQNDNLERASAQDAKVIKDMISQQILSTHTDQQYQISGIFKVKENPHKGYDEFKKKKNHEKLNLWHGTAYDSFTKIIEDGFGDPKKLEVKAGRALGDGIYFAPQASKAIQYASSSYRRHDGGVVLLNDVAYGNWDYGRRFTKKDQDTIYRKGGTGFLYDELAVRKPDQVKIKYAVLVNKALDKKHVPDWAFNETIQDVKDKGIERLWTPEKRPDGTAISSLISLTGNDQIIPLLKRIMDKTDVKPLDMAKKFLSGTHDLPNNIEEEVINYIKEEVFDKDEVVEAVSDDELYDMFSQALKLNYGNMFDKSKWAEYAIKRPTFLRTMFEHSPNSFASSIAGYISDKPGAIEAIRKLNEKPLNRHSIAGYLRTGGGTQEFLDVIAPTLAEMDPVQFSAFTEEMERRGVSAFTLDAYVKKYKEKLDSHKKHDYQAMYAEDFKQGNTSYMDRVLSDDPDQGLTNWDKFRIGIAGGDLGEMRKAYVLGMSADLKLRLKDYGDKRKYYNVSDIIKETIGVGYHHSQALYEKMSDSDAKEVAELVARAIEYKRKETQSKTQTFDISARMLAEAGDNVLRLVKNLPDGTLKDGIYLEGYASSIESMEQTIDSVKKVREAAGGDKIPIVLSSYLAGDLDPNQQRALLDMPNSKFNRLTAGEAMKLLHDGTFSFKNAGIRIPSYGGFRMPRSQNQDRPRKKLLYKKDKQLRDYTATAFKKYADGWFTGDSEVKEEMRRSAVNRMFGDALYTGALDPDVINDYIIKKGKEHGNTPDEIKSIKEVLVDPYDSNRQYDSAKGNYTRKVLKLA